jgi:aminoglycoside phosphotransferase (APT) family kinase protein
MSEFWYSGRPRAEQDVDAELARRLVRKQFPQLAADAVESVSGGWDYSVFRVDVVWAFRFPRRAVVVPGTEREIATLPLLAPLLPVSIPNPVHVGRADEEFPWPFYGAPFLPGAEPDASLSDGQRLSLARPLARALRALHARETLVAVGGGLPFDVVGRADMGRRVPRAREALAAVADLWRPPDQADELFVRALALPPPEPLAVCHGDLHFRQLLVEGDALTGIVDWVDLCRSDPGIDLSLVYAFLPRAARREFFTKYGDIAEASHLRAQVVALNLMAILARYGHDEHVPGVEAEALAGLDRVFD